MRNDERGVMNDEFAKHLPFIVYRSSLRCAHRSSFIVPRSPGYAFVVLMVAMTVMLVALAAALPSVYHESQREKEEELIFRGNEYAWAIFRFQRQFRRYPKSVDELIRTNNMRFLRHAYKDPLSPNGKWRFIHIGPNGALIDSLTMGPQQQQQLVGAFGQSPGAFGQSPGGFGQSPGGFGQSPGGFGQSPSGFGQSPGGFGQSPAGPMQSSSTSGGSSQDEQSAQNGQDAQKDQKEKPKVRPGCEGGKSESAFGDTNLGAALIAGVASCSNKSSIRVYNKKTKYEEWEFLAVGMQPLGGAGMPQPQQPQPQQGLGGQNTQPGQGGGTGGSSFGTSGPGPTPPGAAQQPPEPPLTDQPAPEQPQEPQEGQDTPP
jgi:type II secretory pathway pseudopilin PulG